MRARDALLAVLATGALACAASGGPLLLWYRPDAGLVAVDQLSLEQEVAWLLDLHLWSGALAAASALLLGLLPGTRRAARVGWLAAAAVAAAAFWTGTRLAARPGARADQEALTAAYWAHVLPLPAIAAGAVVLALPLAAPLVGRSRAVSAPAA